MAHFIKPIIVGKNSFIGARVTLLPGTEIGENCIIGAGSVVKGKIPNNSIVIGNHPIESDFRKKEKLNDKFVLLGVATAWDKNKGLLDYLKLADMLDDDYRIVLVGLKKNQIEILPKNVLGIERTANIKELAEIYTAADLFLNLSYCENYPTVNIESLACGTPILTYKTGGSPEIVEDYGGTVVEQGDIIKVLESIKTIKEKGVHKVCVDIGNFGNAKVIDNYLKLYI